MVAIKNFLPGLTRILKVRRKKLALGAKQGSAFNQETLDTNSKYDNIISQKSGSSRTILSTTVQQTHDWTQSTLLKSNNVGDFKYANSQYLTTQIGITGKSMLQG